MVAWSGRCRAPYVPWLVGMTAAVVLAVMWLASSAAEPAPAWVLWLLALVGLIVVAAGLALGMLEVTIEPAGLVIRYGSFGWPVQRFPWPGITGLSAIEVHPMEWGGWGYRWVPWRRGTAAVLRKGPGIRIDRADGRVFVVTIDDPDAAIHAAGQFLIRN